MAARLARQQEQQGVLAPTGGPQVWGEEQSGPHHQVWGQGEGEQLGGGQGQGR